jgi:hypothetical protein
MPRLSRSTWVTYHEVPLLGLDFSEFGDDRAALAAEITASEAELRDRPPNSVLVAIALHKVTIQPELVAFFGRWSDPAGNPIRKTAILFLSRLERLAFRQKGIRWPPNAHFFSDYEDAKAWLISERG